MPSQLHPELAQVPFIVVHPDGRRAGEVSSQFASTHDVGPTLLSLVDIDRPSWMEGLDLSPCSTATSRPTGGRSTTAACTTGSTSAPTSGC